MGNNIINEDAYTKSIQHFNFAAGVKQPGGQAWARQLIEAYLAAVPPAQEVSESEIISVANAGLIAYWEEKRASHADCDLPTRYEWLSIFRALHAAGYRIVKGKA